MMMNKKKHKGEQGKAKKKSQEVHKEEIEGFSLFFFLLLIIIAFFLKRKESHFCGKKRRKKWGEGEGG